jgi:hypothetical protein
MKKRFFAVPFAIAIVVMMVIVSLPGPMSPTDSVLAANWGGSSKAGYGIEYLKFKDSSNTVCTDINGDEVTFTSNSPKIIAIDENFTPRYIECCIYVPSNAPAELSRVKLSLTITNPNNAVVYSGEQMSNMAPMQGSYIIGHHDLGSANIDWSIPGHYTITAKLYYWM